MLGTSAIGVAATRLKPGTTITLRIAIAAALIAPVQGQRGGPSRAVVIDGATVIDGTGAPPLANRAIVLEGPRIAAIGESGTVQIPANARVIQARGKFVIPGLIDGHTHWRGWTGELFLNHGVTSIVDLGNPTDWILAARDAEIGGRIRGPRIFTAAGGIDRRRREPEGGGIGAAGGTAPYIYYVDGAAEARAVTRSLLERGADVIKIFGDLTPEEYHAVTGEAHKVGIAVLGHTNDVYAAVRGGMDGVTHLWGVSATLMTPENLKRYREGHIASPYAWMERDKMDALVTFLVEHGTFINPALVNEHTGAMPKSKEFELAGYDLLMNPELRYVPLTAVLTSLTFWHKLRSYSPTVGGFPYREQVEPAVLEEFRKGYGNAQEFTRRFAKAGGRIFAGTDAAGSSSLPGLSLHQELELLVDSGLTPMQAIVSATRVPAELIKKDYKLGTVSVGKLADLLVLDGDPLADIRNTQKINTIIKNGEVQDRKYHREYSTEFSEVEGVGISTSAAPVPVLTEVVTQTLNQMSQVIHDGGPFELVAKGNNFHPTSLVHVNGRPLVTTYVTRTELRARVETSDIPTEGTYAITVFTPWPGGGRSNVKAMAVK